MTWQKQFHTGHSNIEVLGYLAASEEACRRYFRERVSAKLAESDGAEELRSHLVELGRIGFDLGDEGQKTVLSEPRPKQGFGIRRKIFHPTTHLLLTHRTNSMNI